MPRGLILIPLFCLVSCASPSTPKVAVCNGQHRRPANLYGTVLPNVPLDAVDAAATMKPTSTEAAPADKTPAQPAAGARSALDPKSSEPCGRAA